MNIFKNSKFIAITGVTAVALTALTFYYTSNDADVTPVNTEDVATDTTSATDNTAVEPAVLTAPGSDAAETEAVILEPTPATTAPATGDGSSSYYRAPAAGEPNKPMIIMVRHVNGPTVPCTDVAQSTQD